MKVFLLLLLAGPALGFVRVDKAGRLLELRCDGKPDCAQWCGLSGKPFVATLYHPNGQLREEITYLNGKRHGYVKEFDGEADSSGRLPTGTISFHGIELRHDPATGKVTFERRH